VLVVAEAKARCRRGCGVYSATSCARRVRGDFDESAGERGCGGDDDERPSSSSSDVDTTICVVWG
jgi:hypothetical protein